MIPSNGVLQTSRSLETMLDSRNSESAYNQCISQGRGARYFSNSCTKLIDTLRRKMNIMALESDLQMQAERISDKRIQKEAASRLAVLSKINLFSTQAEETIKTVQTDTKTSDAKENLPDVLTAIKKVQNSVLAYSKLLPNAGL